MREWDRYIYRERGRERDWEQMRDIYNKENERDIMKILFWHHTLVIGLKCKLGYFLVFLMHPKGRKGTIDGN